MMVKLQELKKKIEPIQSQLINHPLYTSLSTLDDIKRFMESHVYAVWDFMSLLKSLQFELTCNSLPWFPVSTAENRYLINEIVLGEESDRDKLGNRTSHFEMYLEAMEESGASTKGIHTFIKQMKLTGDIDWAFKCAEAPQAVKDFVKYTFQIVYSPKLHAKAAVFTFGREDVIPKMFYQLVQDLNKTNMGQLERFTYYLERHIELDGDSHKFLAEKMLMNICGDSPILWEEATLESIKALKYRLALWDYIYLLINKEKGGLNLKLG
ncbi:MAG: DUF3050 domain-containing protein [Bacteroidia bacterium]|nr:DUF3050 domain-containing protein [Bacteroidia bacterium]MCF8428173.1 DUF3050 domain-containing protein [Bacteroidia bacterium]MCF8445437.1 DUF3050 domain-containing protein [Bacteroidia bacterium]